MRTGMHKSSWNTAPVPKMQLVNSCQHPLIAQLTDAAFPAHCPSIKTTFFRVACRTASMRLLHNHESISASIWETLWTKVNSMPSAVTMCNPAFVARQGAVHMYIDRPHETSDHLLLVRQHPQLCDSEGGDRLASSIRMLLLLRGSTPAGVPAKTY